jgi:pimeloyl-ACP methyl ester carboxylesterase
LIPPVYAERWRELVPHAEIAFIEEAGHMLPYEQSDAFAAAIARFLG